MGKPAAKKLVRQELAQASKGPVFPRFCHTENPAQLVTITTSPRAPKLDPLAMGSQEDGNEEKTVTCLAHVSDLYGLCLTPR